MQSLKRLTSLMPNPFDSLIALYVFAVLASETLGVKTFTIGTINGFDVHASAAIFTLPLIYLIDNVVGEVYGRARARQLVAISIGLVALLAICEVLAIALPPSARFAASAPAYNEIFAASIRFTLASIAAYGVGGLLDIMIFSRLRQRLATRPLWLRNGLAELGSQLVDTIVFMVIAFYAFDESLSANANFIASLTVPYLLLRYLIALLQTPLVYVGVGWLRRSHPAPAPN